MKPSELGKILVIAMRPWGYMVVDEPLITMWHAIFGKYSKEQFSAAINAVMATEKGPPEIASVNAMLVKMNQDTPELTEGEAWRVLKIAIGKFGSYAPEEAYAWMRKQHPYVEETARLLGLQEICRWETRDEMTNRAHFWKVLNGQRSRDHTSALLGLPKPKRIKLIGGG
jgi:hypothetical protein